MDSDKRINYLIIITVSYCLLLLIVALPLTPDWQSKKNLAIVFIHTYSFYFVFRLIIDIYHLPFFTKDAISFYTFRMLSAIVVLSLHVAIFAFVIFLSNNGVYNPDLILTKTFPEQKITFYVYDDFYCDSPTLITAKIGFLPIQKKIFQLKYINNNALSIDYADGKFLISDDNCVYTYPKKDNLNGRNYDLRY